MKQNAIAAIEQIIATVKDGAEADRQIARICEIAGMTLDEIFSKD